MNLPAHHRHYATIKMLFTPMNPNNRETFELDNALRGKRIGHIEVNVYYIQCTYIYISVYAVYLLVEWVFGARDT